MKTIKLCPCGSLKRYLECCGRFIIYKEIPDSPEILMRSRYTAFCEGRSDYIKKTMRDTALQQYQKYKGKVKTEWYKLEVLSSYIEADDPTIGFVEFKAFGNHKNQQIILHERSTFNKIAGKWYYVSGIILSEKNANQ